MNRPLFITAAFLTAFVLVLTGGVVAIASASRPAAAASADPPTDAREAQWQALLAQANERLQQAYADQGQAAAPVDDLGALGAARAALLAAPGARLLQPPERVRFEGVTAYEVVLDQGVVYVDAATGQVLYNGPAAAQTALRSRGDDEHDEHEQHEHDDDDDDHARREGADDDD
jgi:hypothetical protein